MLGLDTPQTHGSKLMSLQCAGICKTYGEIQVLKPIDLTVAQGTVVGLIGENGAGKSTFSSILAGITSPTAGTLTLGGAPYRPTTPAEALNLGVALIHQEIRMVTDLSVAENIFLGRMPLRHGRVDRTAMFDGAREALARIGVHDIDPRRPIGNLSIAKQQEIEVARAISRSPKFIIFDEPSASLGEAQVANILDQIEVMRSNGVGVVYISHKLEEVRSIADRIVVLRDGQMVTEFDGTVTTDEMVSAMVGRTFAFEHQAPPPHASEINLSVTGLGSTGKFSDITFDTHRGEIFGFAGLVGAGRTEVVRALAGADKHDTGSISLDGTALDITTPKRAIDAGIVMVPEDRKQLGLLLDQSSSRNLITPWERRITRRGVVRKRDIDRITEKQRTKYDLRGETGIPVGRLSGGNQQKVLLAKWLIEMPRILILDEPTKGVDIGAKDSIYRMIRQLAQAGVTVIVVSSELEEVLGLSHRVAVMAGGRIQGILDRADAHPESVMNLAVSVSGSHSAA